MSRTRLVCVSPSRRWKRPAAPSTRSIWIIKAWTEEAWEDFEYWTTQDRKVLKRILQLLKDIDRNSYEGIGKPERLSGDLSSYWSRRIDDANRIVYRIDGNVVKIVQCGSHYRDK
ncbi:MAG: Txe/YoeB family addiction module toxin [Faecalibacterium prausnitzii]